MFERFTKLTRRLAKGGWTRAEVDRLIAKVEEDGVATGRERHALQHLLTADGYVRVRRGRRRSNFEGPARLRLVEYLGFASRASEPAKPPLTPHVDEARYRANVEILAGQRPTTVRGAEVTFRDRFVPSPTNQLAEVLDWLGAQYDALGLEHHLEPVTYRGKTLHNLIVTIPGETDEKVLLCDHYDVADKEHIRPRNQRQLREKLTASQVAKRLGSIPLGAAVPGADDNASATAALIETAHHLAAARARGVTFEKTIELVHLVGEELPANCLGARRHLANAKEDEARIAACIVLDMIGVDRTGARKVQLNPGRDPRSLDLAASVKQAIDNLDLDLVPVLRPHGSRKSFLHQTDGIHFSRAGVPTLLMNEHVNDDHDRYRAGYHDEFDIPDLMTFRYAADITRAAMAAVATVAGARDRGGGRR